MRRANAGVPTRDLRIAPQGALSLYSAPKQYLPIQRDSMFALSGYFNEQPPLSHLSEHIRELSYARHQGLGV